MAAEEGSLSQEELDALLGGLGEKTVANVVDAVMARVGIRAG